MVIQHWLWLKTVVSSHHPGRKSEDKTKKEKKHINVDLEEGQSSTKRVQTKFCDGKNYLIKVVFDEESLICSLLAEI